jgi:hypothetical protein
MAWVQVLHYGALILMHLLPQDLSMLSISLVSDTQVPSSLVFIYYQDHGYKAYFNRFQRDSNRFYNKVVSTPYVFDVKKNVHFFGIKVSSQAPQNFTAHNLIYSDFNEIWVTYYNPFEINMQKLSKLFRLF